MPVSPADTVQCTTTLDRSGGNRLAAGLIVQCTVAVDSAAAYSINGQLYQDRRRGPVSYANDRGNDISRSALGQGRPTEVQAAQPGPLPVALWFPGSEVHRRAHRGEAWMDLQVRRQYADLPRSREEVASQAPHWYRCRIVNVDPAAFVARLPGLDIPPALPKPVSK
ncbi:MAG: hypothetical protein HZC42_05295 [Candidatus Eisenbacteria bacterium]|nr:hypothetical protein [Candidatus Eisenbacteria bacterium]